MSGAGLFLAPTATPPHFIKDPQAPHYQQHPSHPQQYPQQQQQQPSQYINMASANRKRKADADLDESSMDRMSSSPSPRLPHMQLPPASTQHHNRPISNASTRHAKRARTTAHGRPLSLPRLLETLSADEMRGVLQSICSQHPDIGTEIVTTAPRPSVQSALDVLGRYKTAVQDAFPYGDRPTSDYSYNRVRPALIEMLEALKDFTPHFLPPNEPHPATSLTFLDNATNLIHEMPDWDSSIHMRHKAEAYEEISRAWSLAIREAAKRAGGIQIQYGGWDTKLLKHHELSGGKLAEALHEMRISLGWMEGAAGPAATGMGMGAGGQPSIREQLLGGTYGSPQTPIQIGTW